MISLPISMSNPTDIPKLEILYDADFLDGHLTIQEIAAGGIVRCHLHAFDICLDIGARIVKENPAALGLLVKAVEEQYYAGVIADRDSRISAGERLQ